MNILITGGLGYIGSSLTNFLSNIHHDITVIDNLYTQRYCSLFNRKYDFNFKEADFHDISTEFLKQFNYIIHLAAIVDATNSEKQKDLIEEINTNKTIEFLYKCHNTGIKFIFPSSTSVYGTSNKVVYEDDELVLNPQSPYAESKLKVEKAIKQCNGTILRFGTVCGVSSGIRFQTCINKFCYQAVFNQPLTVWKQNLDLVRPYLCLSDINYIIELTLYNWNKFQNQTFNIVTENRSLKKIIKEIKKHEPYITIDYTECPLLNQFSYEVSTEKIKKLGIEFYGNIDENIKNTINLLRKNND